MEMDIQPFGTALAAAGGQGSSTAVLAGIVIVVVLALAYWFFLRRRGSKAGSANAVQDTSGCAALAAGVLSAVGGRGNIAGCDYCATRLRLVIRDYTKVDEKAVKAAGAAGVIRPDKNTCQIILGNRTKAVYDELKKLL